MIFNRRECRTPAAEQCRNVSAAALTAVPRASWPNEGERPHLDGVGARRRPLPNDDVELVIFQRRVEQLFQCGCRRWTSSMNSTCFSRRLVRMAVRSPLICSVGPEVCWNGASISLAMMLASVVLPSPAARRAARDLAPPCAPSQPGWRSRGSPVLFCPMNSRSRCGRSFSSNDESSSTGTAETMRSGWALSLAKARRAIGKGECGGYQPVVHQERVVILNERSPIFANASRRTPNPQHFCRL